MKMAFASYVENSFLINLYRRLITFILDAGISLYGNTVFAFGFLSSVVYIVKRYLLLDQDVKLSGLAAGADGGIGTTYNIIPGHFVKICRLALAGKFREAAKIQDEANRVVELMIESDNWSYRKAMMKYIGIDCGIYPGPFEPITPAQEKAFLKRFAALGIAKPGQALARR